jgi:DNA-binding transcriptional ArsR family regulator
MMPQARRPDLDEETFDNAVEGSSVSAAQRVFHALSSAPRRKILAYLAHTELSAGEIASRFNSSGPTISRHLGVLRQAGLVTERRDANRILYSLVTDRLALQVGDFLSAVCPEQIILREVRKVKPRAPRTVDATP